MALDERFSAAPQLHHEPREPLNLRIDNIDPQGELALSLLRDAAAQVRPLYSSTAEGTATPENTALGPRDVYVAAMLNGMPVACGSMSVSRN